MTTLALFIPLYNRSRSRTLMAFPVSRTFTPALHWDRVQAVFQLFAVQNSIRPSWSVTHTEGPGLGHPPGSARALPLLGRESNCAASVTSKY